MAKVDDPKIRIPRDVYNTQREQAHRLRMSIEQLTAADIQQKQATRSRKFTYQHLDPDPGPPLVRRKK